MNIMLMLMMTCMMVERRMMMVIMAPFVFRFSLAAVARQYQ